MHTSQQPSFSIRLKIPYITYTSNPAVTIKQHLGQHITILSFQASDIITSDDCVLVDVTYSCIHFSPFTIYYIPVSDIKPLVPNSDKYIVNINNCNVKITLNDPPDTKHPNHLIPINIRATLPNNYSPNGELESQFTYFATIVSQPLNSLCTPLRYMNHSFEPFETPPVKQLYPESYVSEYQASHKDSFETDLLFMVNQYKASYVTFNILSSIDRVIPVTSFSECVLGTTAYVIAFEKIPLDSDINGIILIQPKRIPEYVMFYPTNSCVICVEELLSIKEFLARDVVNYYNFKYVMEVINKK